MQRIVQINIAGRVLPIEEDAYVILKEYITSLERQFTGNDGKEIIEDIENRIAELFSIRLDGGSPAINRSDVQKVMDTLGAASDLHDGPTAKNTQGQREQYSANTGSQRNSGPRYSHDRVLRDPYDKMIGGVCSGLAHYFDIDPTIVRLIMVFLFFTGVGILAYIIAWAVIPAARSREELYNGQPMSFHDITRNVESELQDLKRRGEQMSRDLKDFFSKKK
jgi:phage shock protein PspC (stress-responsive transcriptional regulator)